MQARLKKEEKFKKRLKKVLAEENLGLHRELVDKLVSELNLSAEDCAAALVFLSQPNLYEAENQTERPYEKISQAVDIEIPMPSFKLKSVRYRIEVGRAQNLHAAQLSSLLVEEAGVDISRIDRIEIYEDYTIVDLPEGMPADIFQHLTEVELNQRKLGIKRLKPHRKFRRFRKTEKIA